MTLIILASGLISLIAGIKSILYFKRPCGFPWGIIGVGLLPFGINQIITFLFKIPVSPVSIFGTLIFSIIIFAAVLRAPEIFNRLEWNNAYLRTLWEIDRIILSGLTPKSIIEAIKKAMLEIIDCDALGVYTVGLIPERLSVFANHNLSEDFHKKMLSEYRDFLHTIIMDKKPVLLTNLPDDTNFGFPAFLKSCGYETSLSLPLVLRGLPLGIVLVLSKRKKHYHRKEIQYLEGICRQLIVAIEKIQNIQTIKEMSMESVMALVQAIEMRDPYTKGHSLQVSEIAFELGRLFELGDRELELLKFAGLLHDIGKIAIPESILNKSAKLDEFEWEIMRKHPVKSAEIIQPIKNLSEIGKWILHHHERWDGTGYPAGLKGEEIPFYSRILAICDTYSAMLSDRPYRKKLSFKEAIEEIIRYKGKQFDPRIVEMFLTLPEEFLRRVVGK